MTRSRRGEPDLPPGPARDLVALFQLLRSRRPLTMGQIAIKSDLGAGHISEVLRGWKAPSPHAAEVIARALGADDDAALKARQLAEALTDLNRHSRAKERRGGSRPGPIPESTGHLYAVQGGGRLGIITGDIRRVRHVDIWVNSENTDMKMSRFEEYTISAIIRYEGARRDATGRVIEDIIADELARTVADRVPVAAGAAIMTGPGQLARSHNVRAIIHVAAVYGEPGAGYRQIRDVGRCVISVLTEVDQAPGQDRDVSILFPMLGAGQGGGDIEWTAAVLVGAAADYLSKALVTRIGTVWFLAYTYEELAAFQEVFSGNPRFTAGETTWSVG